MQEEDASSDEEYRNAHGDELEAIALESSSPEPSETLPPFPSQGLRIEELRHLVASCPVGATTNFLCHEVVRQRTVAQGWVDVPSLTDAAKGYYSHTYATVSTAALGGAQGAPQADAPPGTRSHVEVLCEDPLRSSLVGEATHFVSHAWRYRFEDLVASLEAFEADQVTVCHVTLHSTRTHTHMHTHTHTHARTHPS